MNDLMDSMKIQTGKSVSSAGKIDIAGNFDDFLKFVTGTVKKDGIAAVWLVNKFIWGEYKQGMVVLTDNTEPDMAYLQEMRIFNADEELYIRRNRQKLLWRYIADGEGDTCKYVDAMGRLWGEVCSVANPSLLEDRDRKIRMQLPMSIEGAKYYGLVTRNYITYDVHNGQAGYGDYRYLAIKNAGRD